MFELSQLRCFIAVADELHFGRAARRLNMTQPPLSRQIQILERVLDVTLLERSSKTVRLTAAGSAFLKEARHIVGMSESAALMARRVAGGRAGEIAIGFTAASSYRFLPALVARCRDRLPGVALTLNELVSGESLERLAASRIDVALIRTPTRRGDLRFVRVSAEPMLAAVPEAHPLAARDVVSLTDLAEQPVVTFAPFEARYFHDLVAELFSDVGAAPDYAHHLPQVHSILAMVGAGVGVALVPEAAAQLQFRGVALRPIAEKQRRAAELFLAWRTDIDNPLIEAVADIARSVDSVA